MAIYVTWQFRFLLFMMFVDYVSVQLGNLTNLWSMQSSLLMNISLLFDTRLYLV